MGDNGGVRALFRSTTVRIGAVLLVLSLVLALGIVVRNAVRYREAVALDEAGDAQGAYELFHALGGYADAAQRQYHHVPFEEVTWENSDLRAWMNGDFYDGAFTPVQRGLIETVHNENADQSITGASGGAATDDRVFALSETESVIYLNTPAARSDIGAALASQHAAAGPLSISEDGTADWWLRSPGTYGFATQFVDASGTPSLSGANVDLQYGVRPALWINVAGAGEESR